MPDLDSPSDGSDGGRRDPSDAAPSDRSTDESSSARDFDDNPDGEGGSGETPADETGATPGRGRRRRLKPGRRAAGLAAAVLAGAILGGAAMAVIGAPGKSPAASPSPSGAAPGESPSAGSGAVVVEGPAVGSPTAAVTIEIWADYQCPYCRLESAAFGGAIERELALSGKVRVEWRDFAFLGQESADAAVAARCAGRQAPAAYWRYHDLLFVQQQGENQGAFSKANLEALAAAASLDPTAFTACLDDATVAQAVADETSKGRELGVTSTPTLRITGPGGERLIKGFSSTWTALPEAVEAVASAAPSGAPPSGGPTSSAGGSPGSPEPTASAGSPGASTAASPSP